MAGLTVLIPFCRKTPTEAFEETLASVLLHRSSDTEILVANGADYSDAWNTSDDGVHYLPMSQEMSRIELINEAICQAKYEIVFIISPGVEITQTCCDEAIMNFADSQVGIVIPVVYDRKKSNRIFAHGVSYQASGHIKTVRRSLSQDIPGTAIAPHSSAVFFRKALLDDLGLFDPTLLQQFSYIDATLVARRKGWKIQFDSTTRLTVRPQWIPTDSHFLLGTTTERLYFRWFGRHHSFMSLAFHASSFFGDLVRHFSSTVGGSQKSSFLESFLFGRLCGLTYLKECIWPKKRSCRKSVTNDKITSDVDSMSILYVNKDNSAGLAERKVA
ncbi:MAG: glycosyltransferase family 2 protein [Thermoguttaceae bacterium]